MKKLILSIIGFAFLAISAFSQSPESFKYQAVVRDASGVIIPSQAVGVRLTIQQGTAGSTPVYTETFSATTNVYGLVNLEIGTGTPTGSFASIDWSNGPYFIETAIDVSGGTSYVVMGTSQLMSVPYALFAKFADNVVNDSVNDADADPTNEYNTSVILNGTDLETTDGGGTITTDLSSLSGGGTGNWTLNGNNIHNSNTGNVGIGNSNPLYNLTISKPNYPTFSIGTTAFNNDSAGTLEFNEDVNYTGGLCGIMFTHNGAANTLSLIGGCPTVDTIFRANRTGSMNIDRMRAGNLYSAPSNPLSVSGNSDFLGNMTINGNLTVSGSISKGSGTFKIDHPLDPANKYLVHSFVESPEMINIYSGNIVTDANGVAIVTLPSYFEAANKDFRYQLTIIGTFAQAIVKEKISDNKFIIQTDKPNVEVSWSVTGVRADKFADANRVDPEEEKEIKGSYLHPKLYNVSERKSIFKLQEELRLKELETNDVSADQ